MFLKTAILSHCFMSIFLPHLFLLHSCFTGEHERFKQGVSTQAPFYNRQWYGVALRCIFENVVMLLMMVGWCGSA